MRWGYGGRWWSCDGEEGGGGELDAPQTKTARGGGGLGFAHHRCAHDGGGGRTKMSFGHGRRRGFGQQWRRGRNRRGKVARGGSDSGGGAVRTTLSGRRRAVPTALLTRWSSAARGSHAAMARCQAGPARRAASDRWDPPVSNFRIKITPDENRSK
jgi:hypothetical protein